MILTQPSSSCELVQTLSTIHCSIHLWIGGLVQANTFPSLPGELDQRSAGVPRRATQLGKGFCFCLNLGTTTTANGCHMHLGTLMALLGKLSTLSMELVPALLLVPDP